MSITRLEQEIKKVQINGAVSEDQEEFLEQTKKELIYKIEAAQAPINFEFDNLNDQYGAIQLYQPLGIRGIIVNNISQEELELAKETFGFVISTDNGYLIPMNMPEENHVDKKVTNGNLFFANPIKKGAALLVGAYGAKQVLDKVLNHYAPIVAPVTAAVKNIASPLQALNPLNPFSEKLDKIRKAIKKKNQKKDKKAANEKENAIDIIKEKDMKEMVENRATPILDMIEDILKESVKNNPTDSKLVEQMLEATHEVHGAEGVKEDKKEFKMPTPKLTPPNPLTDK